MSAEIWRRAFRLSASEASESAPRPADVVNGLGFDLLPEILHSYQDRTSNLVDGIDTGVDATALR